MTRSYSFARISAIVLEMEPCVFRWHAPFAVIGGDDAFHRRGHAAISRKLSSMTQSNSIPGRALWASLKGEARGSGPPREAA